MLLKEAGFLTNRARWVAGLSALALLAVGMITRQKLQPSVTAPAKSAPARTRPIVSQDASRIAANFAKIGRAHV